MNYEQDINIDEESLDIEWLEQPKLMLQYSKHCADCERKRDEAKEALELIQAELDNKIRQEPEKYNIEKVTEGTVKACILQRKAYKDANKAYLDAKYEFNIAKGAVEAFEQRKVALENLVRLHGQSYFAGPSVPRDITWERDERQKKMNAEMGKRLNGRRTK